MIKLLFGVRIIMRKDSKNYKQYFGWKIKISENGFYLRKNKFAI